MKVYFISGLGADKRAFSFLDLSFCDPVFIDWPEPLPAETLGGYAERLYSKINDEHATVVGLSFGGMLATEMAIKHPALKVIIIASAKTYREIPGYLRFWRKLPVYNYLPKTKMKVAGKFVLRILGAQGSAERALQYQILQESNPMFTRWAMHAIVNWKNETVPQNLVHIHGSADKLLRYKYVKAHHTIKDGQHVMIMDKAAELSELLKKLITS
ncbi:MAG: alpha/beta hydrolase [Segetibacter sp.]|nr:alpha/beta hydrolase [Segetibacter sp.]